jgi:hypothetical protein
MNIKLLLGAAIVAASLVAIEPVSAKGTITIPDGKGGWKAWTPKPKSKDLASGVVDGAKRTVTKNPDGSHTVTIDDGKTATSESHAKLAPGIYVDDGKGGWKKYEPKKAPKGKPRVIGSSTYEGRTTVVTLNPDGSHTVTTTDANGNTTSETHPAR